MLTNIFYICYTPVMSTKSSISNVRIRRLAQRLEHDIQSRGLGAGDRYMTGVEVSRQLGVSTAMAHRAMSLLVDKQILPGRNVAEHLWARRPRKTVAA